MNSRFCLKSLFFFLHFLRNQSIFPHSSRFLFFFFNDTAPPEIYPLSLHDALPILCAASPSASLAVASSIPAISNMIRPGFTTATQRSGAPLPLPMRVSAGFLVNGLSGKMRIHNFPPRLMNRVMATRDASICRSVIHAHSMAFSPYSPNDSSPPRHALPLRRPRICFRYFTFFGINIVLFSLPLHAWARPRQVQQSCPCSLLLRHRSEEHTSELQSPCNLVCRLLLEKKKH